MTDVFEYASPMGWLGRMADQFFLRVYMTKLLINRNKEIKTVAEGDRWKGLLAN